MAHCHFQKSGWLTQYELVPQHSQSCDMHKTVAASRADHSLKLGLEVGECSCVENQM
jgi:hypothetical protein